MIDVTEVGSGGKMNFNLPEFRRALGCLRLLLKVGMGREEEHSLKNSLRSAYSFVCILTESYFQIKPYAMVICVNHQKGPTLYGTSDKVHTLRIKDTIGQTSGHTLRSQKLTFLLY